MAEPHIKYRFHHLVDDPKFRLDLKKKIQNQPKLTGSFTLWTTIGLKVAWFLVRGPFTRNRYSFRKTLTQKRSSPSSVWSFIRGSTVLQGTCLHSFCVCIYHVIKQCIMCTVYTGACSVNDNNSVNCNVST